MPYGIVQADQLQTSVTGGTLGPGNATNFKNRIINGAMVIDQRNAGAAVTPTNGQYTLDRWAANLSQASKFTIQQNAGSVTPPAGFSKYLGITSSSAYSVAAGDFFGLYQLIEGFNFADMAWGTANAKTVTLSAWVYSSLTGTFGGALFNSGQSYSYPFTYSIPVANTWTQISVTIAGPTAGTWVGATNGAGVGVQFNLGTGTTYSGAAGSWAAATYVSATGATSVVGTNGATFYITGVQLEVGSSATGFEYRDYGSELYRCLRYFERVGDGFSGRQDLGIFTYGSGTTAYGIRPFQVQKRTTPSITINGATGWRTLGTVNGAPVTLALSDYSSMEAFYYVTAGYSAFTSGDSVLIQTQDGTGSTCSIFISAEL